MFIVDNSCINKWRPDLHPTTLKRHIYRVDMHEQIYVQYVKLANPWLKNVLK